MHKYIRMYIHTRLHTHIYTYTYMYMHTYTYTYTHVLHIHIHIYIHIDAYSHVHVYTHIYTDTDTYTQTQAHKLLICPYFWVTRLEHDCWLLGRFLVAVETCSHSLKLKQIQFPSQNFCTYLSHDVFLQGKKPEMSCLTTFKHVYCNESPFK